MFSLLNCEPSSEALSLQTLEAEKNRRLTEDRLRYYRPYPKELDFHAAGSTHHEQLLMAGNQPPAIRRRPILLKLIEVAIAQ